MKRLMFLLPVILLLTCCRDVYRYTKNEFYSMSTFVTVISEEGSDAAYIEDVTQEYESLFSRTMGESEMYKLNKEGTALLSDEVYTLLEEAVKISRDTDFTFNPVMGRLTELWDIVGGSQYVPEKELVDEALKSSSIDNIILENGSATLNNGAAVDLGAIAKGYILQKVLDGVDTENICISFGGNVGVKGDSEYNKNNGKKGWRVSITNPFDKSVAFGSISLEYGFVSVSGAYERFFEKDGKIYHHIFDTKTGYPAQSDIASAAVISKSGLEADAFSTALFVMGRDKAIDFYRNSGYQFDMILVTNDGEIYITRPLYKTFEMSEYAYDKNGKKMTIIEIE